MASAIFSGMVLLLLGIAGAIFVWKSCDLHPSRPRRLSRSELEAEVLSSIQTEMRNGKAAHLSLVQRTSNQFDGSVEITIDYRTQQVPVEVTYDGDRFIWRMGSTR